VAGQAVAAREGRGACGEGELVEEDRRADAREAVGEELVGAAEEVVADDLGQHDAVVRQRVVLHMTQPHGKREIE
jgi:hypothetical protein